MKRQAFALVGLTAVVSFLLGLVVASSRPAVAPGAVRTTSPRSVPEPLALASGTPVSPPAPLASGVDFAAVAARLNAAVVNVDTTTHDTEEGSRLVLPRRWPDDVREGSGSGFIIDPAGYILTNYHVISDADRVTVTLGDGRVFKAAIVGIDPAIDVALLQISASEPLPAAPLGSSSALRVGEWVCAIGNPLGYVHSVTVGVVSFLGRKVFDQSLDALIQTDAAITFGNSGGPLINARGQVVGITTAISAQAANIGFAVPIDQVVSVMSQMRDAGRVARGYLGVGLTNVTPALQRALRLQPARGALVQDVSADTPAERAGLRPYDVVVGADQHAIQSDEELIRYVSGRAPGTVTRLDIWREGTTHTLPVKLTERPLPPAIRAMSPDAGKVRPASRSDQLLGLTVSDLDAATAKRRNLPDTLVGVLVTAVDAAGPSRVVPIREGQIVLEINRRRIASAAEYRVVVSTLRPGAPVALFIYDPASKQRLIYSIVTDPQ
jgi:serine protease Do